jgi:Spy/CpxP family protein refolding chaperone
MRCFLTFVLILAFSFPCLAQKGGKTEGQREGGGRSGIMEALELTPTQREEFMQLRREFRLKDSVNFANLNRLRGELLDESAKSVVDTAQINKIAYEISQVHLTLSLNMSKNVRKVKEILTNEQFERFIEHRKNRNHRNFAKKRGENKQNQ